ncbi:unnamed protein product [Phytophthora lilii]|uniref:Unnamed protein product n=1 Tax=Phytophthora lilii TaxID=2077276 RepID=A0A9W6U251_9STRA|nr:unnamed protein product [Phytophthora lilii]
MDYSQNVTVPSVANTPSQWSSAYYSQYAALVFSYKNEGVQTNYLYDESTSGKGSDQINPILAHFVKTNLVPSGKTRLTVYADNCSGQNKNNYVIKFFLTLVDMAIFERTWSTKFLVKGLYGVLAISAHSDDGVLDDGPRGRGSQFE